MAILAEVDADVVNEGINLNMQAAASGGDEVLNRRGTVLVIHNGDTSAKTVTLESQIADDPPLGSADLAIAVPGGAIMQVNLGDAGFSHPTTRRVAISYSAVTSLRVGAFRRINV